MRYLQSGRAGQRVEWAEWRKGPTNKRRRLGTFQRFRKLVEHTAESHAGKISFTKIKVF